MVLWFDSSISNIVFQILTYFIVDNVTKCIVVQNPNQLRRRILVYESMFLGLLITFLSLYYYVPYILVCFWLIHTIGTIYSTNSYFTIKQIIEIVGKIILYLLKWCFGFIFRHSPSVAAQTNTIPKKYQYNFNLKPTNDIRLQQSSFVQTLPRPGMYNLYGTTCSLNALLQSLASLNRFYSSLQRTTNLSRFKYDPIVPAFLNLMAQLRNDHRTLDYNNWNKLIDTSDFISRFNITCPNLLTPNVATDICELFQCMIDLLNNSLSQQSTIYSTNVVEQVQNSKLTTFSLEYLNRLFIETEEQLHDKITLDSIDTQTSIIIQYVDVTWLLHHIQIGSIIKHNFSGQLLHAHCCNNCSHVNFRTEPFQILPLTIGKTSQTLHQILFQLTKIEIIDSVSCSYCSSQTRNEQDKPVKHDALLSTIVSAVSPIVTSRRQLSDHIFSSTPISSSTMNVTSITKSNLYHKIKGQIMIANFPDVLCIQLKRFTYDRLSNRTIKLHTAILIEPERILDLSQLHYTTWLGLSNPSILYRYRLIAVCIHLSENPSTLSSIYLTKASNQHYVCAYRADHNRWLLSDDERIIEINDANNFFQTSYVTENCYLLFYERYS